MKNKNLAEVRTFGYLIIAVFIIGGYFALSLYQFMLVTRGVKIASYAGLIQAGCREEPIGLFVLLAYILAGVTAGAGIIRLRNWARILLLWLASFLVAYAFVSFNFLLCLFSGFILYYFTRRRVRESFIS